MTRPCRPPFRTARAAAPTFAGDHVPHRRPVEIAAGGHDPAHDVALGNDAGQAVAVQHGHGAHAALGHVTRRLAHGDAGIDVVRLPALDDGTDGFLHGSSPSA